MKTVLFSPIGDTDPDRGCYDGAMIHIARHYKPEIVYLFLTDDMAKWDREDNRYEAYIKRVLPACEVKKFVTDITQPHDFDNFVGVFAEKLAVVISEQGKDCELLLNISSGTPAMKIALSLEATWGKINFKAIQVASPQKASNRQNPPAGENFVLDDHWATNIDNDAQENSENRCKEVDLLLLRHNSAQRQIKALAERYDYGSALAVLQNIPHIFHNDLQKILQHAQLRMNLQTKQAKIELSALQGIDLFPVKDKKAEELTEYFMLMQIKQEKQELADFIVKMTPFLYRLSEFYLMEVLGFPLREITEERSTGYIIVPEKVKAYDKRNSQNLFTYLEKEYGRLGTGYIGFDTVLRMLKYLRKVNYAIKKGLKVRDDVYCKLAELRSYEKILRNPIAHDLELLTEEKIRQISRELLCKKNGLIVRNGKSSKDLLQDMKAIFDDILGSRAKQYRFIYKDINTFIISLLQERDIMKI